MSMSRLEEILSAVSGVNVSRETFDISPPAQGEGNLIEITLRPIAATGFYGTRNVTMTRLIITNSTPRELPYKGQTSVHELVRDGSLGAFYQYFILSKASQTPLVVPRLLKLSEEDVFDDPITVTSNVTRVQVRARPDSYFFTGVKEVILRF